MAQCSSRDPNQLAFSGNGEDMSDTHHKRLDETIFTVFDFETTGLAPYYGDRIVEFAFIRYSFKKGIIEEFSNLVNPMRPIPEEASSVHGIYDHDVAGKQGFKVHGDDIMSMIKGTVLAGHNVYFDLRFLEQEMMEIGYKIKSPYLCTMGFPGFIGGRTRQGLGSVCDERGIRLVNAHSALADTRATAELLGQLIGESIDKGLHTFGDLAKMGKSYKFISSWR